MARRKVLFVCLGNACRSQMAEAFARTYGSDVMEPSSAGLTPASMIPEVTHAVMSEKGIQLQQQFPKMMPLVRTDVFDLVVNLSGYPLRTQDCEVREWTVRDPMGSKDSVHREVRDEIERLVMNLILELRQAGRTPTQQPAVTIQPENPSTDTQRRRPRMLR